MVACQGLGKLGQCSGGWCWISSLWSARECPVMSYEMSMGLELLWAACILKLRAMFVCSLNLHGMSCSGTCWPLGSAWCQCRYGDV